MKFGKLSEGANLSKVIQCDDMDNDTLVVRLPDKIEDKKPVMLKEGQYAILYKKGKVHDAIHKKGIKKWKNGDNLYHLRKMIAIFV